MKRRNENIAALTILYDGECGLCRRLKCWIEQEPAFIAIECLSLQSEDARQRYPSLAERLERGEFLVVDNFGSFYVEEEARLLCFWALRRYRRLAFRMAKPPLRNLVIPFFRYVSSRREKLSNFLGLNRSIDEKAQNHRLFPCNDSRVKEHEA